MEQQNYQRILLSGPTIDGEPGLPDDLFGLADETLADLAAAIDPVPPQYDGLGYWPIHPADPLPPNKVSAGRSREIVGGLVKWIDELADAPRPSGTEINAERDRRIAAGKTFTVTGYGDVALQGRIQDQVNLQARLIAAQTAKALGVTDPLLVIRDANNVNHMLTPDQVIELVSDGTAWIEATMQVSWDMKDGVAPFENGAPYDYAANEAYWP
ncbi:MULTISPECIES: DUF4376 domain-containing protein [unclassified Shinella]|uniref:DUF4376 domain-containing protein n=1 Tax=unclassified Shinella TaxID=2643062 RepID=UPI00234F8930|nr:MULTISPECIES: hypothetical protein [unclassified Shinella]MCO5153389.1 DUF4376 domain-containing protein [Shinella sp.]MDC7260568.1 DUF4376 domain-containing protein [Shinella sp. HY16]MDC7267463.1 DUF4376 domain-containing protein [Shinella sp. YZ44]